MRESKIEEVALTDDILGKFGFRVVWRYSSHYAYVTVYEVIGREEHGAPLFERAGAVGGPDFVDSIEEAEKYLYGSIKWDGCSDLTSGYHHNCGQQELAKHCALLKYVWQKSRDLVDSGGECSSEWKEYEA